MKLRNTTSFQSRRDLTSGHLHGLHSMRGHNAGFEFIRKDTVGPEATASWTLQSRLALGVRNGVDFMKLTNVALALVLSSAIVVPSYAQTVCTQQQAMAKGTELSQALQAKMAKDPSGGQALMMKMQPVMQAYQSKIMAGGVVDWSAMCAEYDELLKQTN